LREGVLYRRFREGETAIPGFLDDYSNFLHALIDLYETGFDATDLELAVQLARDMIERFEDRETGGFFSTSEGDGTLATRGILRMKDDYDGAEPSGNSIAALSLLRLAAITGDEGFRTTADRTLTAFARKMSEQPAGLPQMLVAYQWSTGKPLQVILAGDRDSPDTQAMAAAAHKRFLPNRVVAMATDAGPEARAMVPVDGRATAYLCENFACQLPVNDLTKFESMLDELLK